MKKRYIIGLGATALFFAPYLADPEGFTERVEARKQAALVEEQPSVKSSSDIEFEQIYFAKQLVSSRLKDPNSAIFGSVYYSPGNATVCGSINSKNSYGGYTGDKPFIVYRNGDIAIGANANSSWLAHC